MQKICQKNTKGVGGSHGYKMRSRTKSDAAGPVIYDVNFPNTPFNNGSICTHVTPPPTIIIIYRVPDRDRTAITMKAGVQMRTKGR